MIQFILQEQKFYESKFTELSQNEKWNWKLFTNKIKTAQLQIKKIGKATQKPGNLHKKLQGERSVMNHIIIAIQNGSYKGGKIEKKIKQKKHRDQEIRKIKKYK